MLIVTEDQQQNPDVINMRQNPGERRGWENVINA